MARWHPKRKEVTGGGGFYLVATPAPATSAVLRAQPAPLRFSPHQRNPSFDFAPLPPPQAPNETCQNALATLREFLETSKHVSAPKPLPIEEHSNFGDQEFELTQQRRQNNEFQVNEVIGGWDFDHDQFIDLSDQLLLPPFAGLEAESVESEDSSAALGACGSPELPTQTRRLLAALQQPRAAPALPALRQLRGGNEEKLLKVLYQLKSAQLHLVAAELRKCRKLISSLSTKQDVVVATPQIESEPLPAKVSSREVGSPQVRQAFFDPPRHKLGDKAPLTPIPRPAASPELRKQRKPTSSSQTSQRGELQRKKNSQSRELTSSMPGSSTATILSLDSRERHPPLRAYRTSRFGTVVADASTESISVHRRGGRESSSSQALPHPERRAAEASMATVLFAQSSGNFSASQGESLAHWRRAADLQYKEYGQAPCDRTSSALGIPEETAAVRSPLSRSETSSWSECFDEMKESCLLER